MKKIKSKAISISLYILSGLFCFYGIWSLIAVNSQIKGLIDSGKLVQQGNEYLIVNYFVTSSASYFVYAIILAFLACFLTKLRNQGKTCNRPNTSKAATPIEVGTNNKSTYPLSLLNGRISTHLKESFEPASIKFSDSLLAISEEVPLLESYLSDSSDSEIIVAETTPYWPSLDEAVKSIYNHFELSTIKPVYSDHLFISEQKSFGAYSGFYICEKETYPKVYLCLDVNHSTYLIRYITDKTAEEALLEMQKFDIRI